MKLPKISSCDRVSFILNRIKDKRVLHLGCADWPFTETKLKNGTLLHQLMTGVAAELVGLDLETQGIRMMQTAGIKNVFVGNSEHSLYEMLQSKFDVIVAGEIIEHVLNAELFLNSIKSVCHQNSILIITTVNFAPIKKIPRLLLRREVVHPDHVYYFSISTLSCLLEKTGYQPEEWATYWWDVGYVSKIANKLLSRINSLQYFSDNICVVCRPIF